MEFRHLTTSGNPFHPNLSKKKMNSYCKHRTYLNKRLERYLESQLTDSTFDKKQLHHSNFDSHYRSKNAITDVHI